jgi:hypothetical protein
METSQRHGQRDAGAAVLRATTPPLTIGRRLDGLLCGCRCSSGGLLQQRQMTTTTTTQ